MASTALEQLQLQANQYFLVSAHREENVDSPRNLTRFIALLNSLAKKYAMPIIVSTHPRTQNRLADLKLEISPLIQFLKQKNIREQSFSKYVFGIISLMPHVKKNNFLKIIKNINNI